MEIIAKTDPQHWGSYDGVDHGFESRAQSPISRPAYAYPYEQLRGPGVDVAEPVAMDPLPLPSADWTAMFQPETRGALQYVRSELQPTVMQALRATAWVPLGQQDVARGTIEPQLSTVGLAWADQAVAAGSAVLVELGSVPSGQPVFEITGQPDAVAMLARAGGPAAIVAIPPALDNMAQQAAAQPLTPPQLPPAAAGVPWKAVALIGGGVVLVAGLWVAAGRSKR